MAQSKHISIGRLGETIAATYLENRGFSVRARNYRKKWGELDIVAYKSNVLHFVEVKAGSWEGRWPTEGKERHRPEDHMHKNKRTRLGRAIQSYVAEFPLTPGEQWTVDLVVILVNEEDHRAHVRVLWNILLD
jgi:putative endonuclease